MSSQTPVGGISKAVASSSKSSSGGASNPGSGPAVSQTQQFFSHDLGSTRRSGSASNTKSVPAPRNAQTAKPKHKQGKRFRALDEDADAETFSMQNPHGRRGQQSITHLMQFALPPRPSAQQQHHRHSYNGPRRTGRTWGMGSGHHAVDKARYIHANYRFIVDPRGDYHAQAEDADIHLDWNNVLQVIASAKSQGASCPICLGEPTAPRMAKCGHIFCLPCLIRYMHSEDAHGPSPEKRARWKKCPICWDSVYISETRPVRWYIGQENDPPREGDDVVLRLVRRKPGSTLAMPRESAETLAKGDDIPWHLAAEVMDYARVMKGSETYMIEQYDEALAAVELQEKEDELMFGEDSEWTGRAIRLLKEAKEKVKGIGNPPAQPTKPESTPAALDRPPIEFNPTTEGVPAAYLQTHPDPALNPSGPSLHPSQVPRTLSDLHTPSAPPPPSEYLFYQGLLHYYLSPLDIRILRSAFGSYSSFPSSILPRVSRISSGHVVDDDLRKRIKYLGHLPHGCEVAFLECDWRDVVPAAILAEFQSMLDRRTRRNDEKDAREEKERVRIERAEERELANILRGGGRRPSVSDTDGFFSSAGVTPLLHGPGMDGGSLPSTSPPGLAQAPPRPGFAPLASPGTSPLNSRAAPTTVWGTAIVSPASPDLHASLPSDREWRHEDDGWLQGWEKDLLDLRDEHDAAGIVDGVQGLRIGDSAWGAVEGTASVGVANGGGNGGAGGGGKKGKGKKGKKITLMSTATARRGA